MTPGKHTSDAHTVLEYLITRALLQGKLGTSSVQIPMTDMFNKYEGLDFSEESAALVLNVSITTTWDESSGDLDFLEENVEMDEERDDDGQ
jgi:hypothetical protein